MTRIGRNQLRILVLCASPYSLLLTHDLISDSLVRRGLLKERVPDKAKPHVKAACISPNGLRVLADEMEAGRLDEALVFWRKQAAARKAKIAAKQKRKVT